MIQIDPTTLTEREQYKLLTGSIIPRPIAFVSSKGPEGILNAAPFSYFNIVSSNPPLVSISVQRHNGKMKDTARNITQVKEAVIHMVNKRILSDVNETAKPLPSHLSELDLTTLTRIKSTHVSVDGIKEAPVRMEVTLEQHLTFGEPAITTDLLILRIRQYHFNDNVYEGGKINPLTLEPQSRLAGTNYASLGEVTSLERPK